MGENSSRMFIAVHGNMSSKSDIPIIILAEEASKLGYQILSFDLPEHGDRVKEHIPCKVQNCISDLEEIIEYAKEHSTSISLMANSIGAYFSLLAYKHEVLEQSLFLSPVVDMSRILHNIMKWSNITEEQLYMEQEITTSFGPTLYWDYYQYVMQNPIKEWEVPTSILYGKKDDLCEHDVVSCFAKGFNCDFQISNASEHHFHTEKDLTIYRNWLRHNIKS